MVTNNCINLKSAGIVKYDAAGNFSSAGNPLTVVNGGTEDSSLTAYCVLCGGTTSTSPVQPIASVGTAGQVLVSNGPSALPTMQTLTSTVKYVIYWQATAGGLSASTTYYAVNGGVTLDTYPNNTTSYSTRIYIPITGSINICYGQINNSTGGAANPNTITVGLKVNNSTSANVTTSIALSSGIKTFSSTTLGLSVTAGDYVELFVTTPSGTMPGTTGITASILVN